MKITHKIFFILVAFVLFLTNSCKKDESSPVSEIWGSAINADIVGRVLDENGNAVSGAAIKAGNATDTTDINGVFYLNDASMYENLGYVNVNKQGYFVGSRSFVPRQGTNVVNIRILMKNNAGSVSATNGGSVQAEGVSIKFNGGSFVKGNTTYNGQVEVAINYINPESQFFAEEMPGNLIGVQNENSTGLISYGMVAVELTDGNGNEVKIADGTSATINFPVPLSLQSSALAEIDLWSFDETNGYWVHEGKATLQSGVYIANVSHFSFWNCDIPMSFVMLNGQITDAAGNGVQGAKVKITSATFGSETDYTSSTGNFGGNVPDGEPLTITVEVICDSSGYLAVYTGQIGPFSSATTLGPIAISNPPSATIITGTVTDCNNNTLHSGYVVANGQVHYLANGQFTFIDCGTLVSITPYASPVWAAGQPQNFTLTGGTYNAGTLQACNSGNITGTVTDIEGNVYRTVKIGSQWWMQENLRVSAGIAEVADSVQWHNIHISGSQIPAWCYYDNNLAYSATYGKLYNWYAVNTGNLCPNGWHIPTDDEWKILEMSLGMSQEEAEEQMVIRGDSANVGGQLKATTLWTSPNEGATNSSGFTALPGGGTTRQW